MRVPARPQRSGGCPEQTLHHVEEEEMGWFSSKKPAPAPDPCAGRREEAAARSRREDAWRTERDAALKVLHQARRAHASARELHDRYAPGPQKTAAATTLNTAADQLAEAEAAYAAVDDYRTWSRDR